MRGCVRMFAVEQHCIPIFLRRCWKRLLFLQPGLVLRLVLDLIDALRNYVPEALQAARKLHVEPGLWLMRAASDGVGTPTARGLVSRFA